MFSYNCLSVYTFFLKLDAFFTTLLLCKCRSTKNCLQKNGEQTVCKTNRGRVIEGDNSHGTRGGKQGQIVHKTEQY